MNRIGMIIAVFLLIAVAAASTMFFSVDERQIAVVYAFGGEVTRAINEPEGEPVQSEAGLHFKWPWPIQTVRYIDRRIQTLDNSTPVEILTSESNMGLVVDWFIKWRVVDAKQFIRATGGVDVLSAEKTLISNVQTSFNNEVARRTVQQVLDSERQELMGAVRQGLTSIAANMGIEIVDVRIKRVDYSAATAPKIFDQMITERRTLAEKLRAQGNAEKEARMADADKQYQIAIAQAYEEAQRLRGQGDAEATRIFADAFGRDPDFAEFYRSLQAYRESFNHKSDVMLLDPNSDFFRYMQSAQRQRGMSPNTQ